MPSKRKWYVVWVGSEPGVCDSWAECEARVKGVPGARYKSYPTQEDAVRAFRDDPSEMDVIKALAHAPTQYVNYEAIPDLIIDSIAVDGACSKNPGVMEYRGVDVPTGAELFHGGPYPQGTNNIAEFLAIVHALALFEKQGNNHTAIYSDSRTAIGWVARGKCNTKLAPTPQNAHLRDVIRRAERWLNDRSWPRPNVVRKWDTDNWGEIPADFGRK